MNSAQIIVDCATEKRRLNPVYRPSFEELKAVDAVLIAQERAEKIGAEYRSPEVFMVELTDAQLLNAWCQASNALNRTFKDIERGRCTEADAVVQRELYSVLSKAVYALPKGGAL